MNNLSESFFTFKYFLQLCKENRIKHDNLTETFLENYSSPDGSFMFHLVTNRSIENSEIEINEWNDYDWSGGYEYFISDRDIYNYLEKNPNSNIYFHNQWEQDNNIESVLKRLPVNTGDCDDILFVDYTQQYYHSYFYYGITTIEGDIPSNVDINPVSINKKMEKHGLRIIETEPLKHSNIIRSTRGNGHDVEKLGYEFVHHITFPDRDRIEAGIDKTYIAIINNDTNHQYNLRWLNKYLALFNLRASVAVIPYHVLGDHLMSDNIVSNEKVDYLQESVSQLNLHGVCLRTHFIYNTDATSAA